MTKIADMIGVREHIEQDSVELWVDDDPKSGRATGRLIVRAYCEGGNAHADIDLLDLIEWLRFGPSAGRLDGSFALRAAL